jgi:putative ABC transport system permease protein
MTESLLLGLVASAAGALAGVVAVEAMPRWLADQLPTVMAARVDLRVLAFTVALSLATVVLFGLVPALLASRHDLRGALAAGAPGAGGGPRRIQSTLLVLEAALALVLLVAATLLVESLVRLQRTDPGFDTEQVLTFRLALPRTRYPDAARRRAFFSGTVARVRALPGVAAAGAVNMSPLTPRYSCDSFGLADRPAPPAGQEPCAESRAATADYFRAMGIPLRSGRVFDGSERPDGPLVIVVSETMARKYWPDGGALGQRFKWGCVACDTPWLTVIGVVGDVKHYSLEEDAPPEVYSPLEQTGSSAMTVAVRTSRDPASLAGEVRDVVRSLDPALAVSEMFTTRELVGRATAAPAFRTQLLTAFALVALGLAVAGVYGVLSFFVAQRRREIGIRLALGATPGGVRRYIIRRGLSAAALGTIIGLAAAVPLMRLLGDLLFGVKPDDPMAFAAGPLLLLGAALLACYLPARRATLLDPVATIRTD